MSFLFVKKVELHGLQLLSSNERGSTFQMPGQRSKNVLLIHRTKGSVSTAFEGEKETAMRLPKNLLLISGTIKLDAKDLSTGEEVSLIIDAPTQIKLYSNVQHSIRALTECCFLEFSTKKIEFEKTRVATT